MDSGIRQNGRVQDVPHFQSVALLKEKNSPL